MQTSLSKLGSHVDRRAASGYAYARTIFSNEDIGIAASSSAAGCKVVFGHWRLSDDVKRAGLMTRPAEQMAAEYWDATYDFTQYITAEGGDLGNVYFVGYNEPVLDAAEMREYALFEKARMQLGEAMGLKCAIGSFSVGSPQVEDIITYKTGPDGEPVVNHIEPDKWTPFYPALEQCHKGGHVLALHEYWGNCPAMWYGPNQTAAYEAGTVQPFYDGYAEGWLACRYRKVWRLHISPNNWTNTRIVITECGADFIPGGPAEQAYMKPERGYRDWLSKWRGKWHNDALQYLSRLASGYTLTTPARSMIRAVLLDGTLSDDWLYLAALIWYDEQTRKDNYLLGTQVFTDGSFGWGNFDISGPMHDLLYRYIDAMTIK